MNIDLDLLKKLPFPLRVEVEENIIRKDFTESELAGIQQQMIDILSQPEHKQQGKRTDLNHDDQEAGETTCTKSFVQVPPDPSRRVNTTQRVAELFGESEPTVRKRIAVVEAAEKDPETFAPIAEEMDRTRNVDGAHKKMQREKRKRETPAPTPHIVEASAERWTVDQADCLAWFAAQPADSLNLVFGSPPYEQARLYLEDGKNVGIARDTDAWVAWMVDVYKAALRCCTGLVAFVVEGQTKDYAWSVGPAMLMAELHRAGITVRKPPIYQRVGIPGSGGPDWLRNDYEFIICATRGGQLPWSDNTALGQPPKYEPGGDPTHRTQNGSRVNGSGVGHATMEDRNNLGPHRARREAGRVYQPPEKANPGNVILCKVGGGNMGDDLCHENEAPFPESLAEFFVRSFCPPGGIVCDPFSGSGTTGKMAVQHGRRFRGCDLRASQVELTRRRLAHVQQLLPLENL